MECYHTVYTEGTGEIVEKKSRFIAEVFPVSNEEEAFAHLEEIRKKHWDARHHCWAYVIGRNPAAERMSDDGEPDFGAGVPAVRKFALHRLRPQKVLLETQGDAPGKVLQPPPRLPGRLGKGREGGDADRLRRWGGAPAHQSAAP